MNRFLKGPSRWLVMLIVCAWTVLSESEIWAQNYCINPPPNTVLGGFTLNKSRVCVNNQITVTNTTQGATNLLYIYGYNGSSITTPAPIANTTQSFTAPGSFTVLQLGSSQGTGLAKCETVTVLPNEAFDFSTKACENRQVSVDFKFTPNTERYDEVEVDWGDGTKQRFPVANLKNGPITHQYPNGGANYNISVQGVYKDIPDCNAQRAIRTVTTIAGTIQQPFVSQLMVMNETSVQMRIQGPTNTDFEVLLKQPDGNYKTVSQIEKDGSSPLFSVPSTVTSQCFQVRTLNSCSTPSNNEEYCTIALDAKAGAGQNNVTWTPYAGSSSTILWRLQRNGAAVGIPGNSNRNTRSYTDQNDIRCNTQYCYRMTAEAGRTTYISNAVCVTGTSSNLPNALSNVTVSVQDNGQVSVRTIDPNPSGVGTYTLLVSRSDSPSGAYTEIGQAINKPTFDDGSARASQQSHCYKIVLRNECGQESPLSAPACTVWLTSKSPRALDWSAEPPFTGKPVDKYEIEFYDRDSGNRINTIQVGANTHREFDPDDPNLSNRYRYRIVAISPDGSTSYSNFYELQVEAGIFAPLAFTPNGDGNNDHFQVLGFFADDFRLTVFNRWGEAIFSTTSFKAEDGWNGNVANQPALAGTYTWRVEVRDKMGKQTVKAGAVLLIR